MARYDHLPIWKTAMDLAVLLEHLAGNKDVGRTNLKVAEVVGGALVPFRVSAQIDAIAAKAAPTNAPPTQRPGFSASVEMPGKALPRLRRKLKAAGIPHIAAAETGYLKSGHKRRELIYSWAPPGAFPLFHPS